MTQISILGCGWLGLPLAKQLIAKGNRINGSTTTDSKLSILQNTGINAFLVSIEEDQISETIIPFLDKSDVLIIDIPPKLRAENQDSEKKVFVEKIKNLIPFIEKAGVKKILFVS